MTDLDPRATPAEPVWTTIPEGYPGGSTPLIPSHQSIADDSPTRVRRWECHWSRDVTLSITDEGDGYRWGIEHQQGRYGGPGNQTGGGPGTSIHQALAQLEREAHRYLLTPVSLCLLMPPHLVEERQLPVDVPGGDQDRCHLCGVMHSEANPLGRSLLVPPGLLVAWRCHNVRACQTRRAGNLGLPIGTTTRLTDFALGFPLVADPTVPPGRFEIRDVSGLVAAGDLHVTDQPLPSTAALVDEDRYAPMEGDEPLDLAGAFEAYRLLEQPSPVDEHVRIELTIPPQPTTPIRWPDGITWSGQAGPPPSPPSELLEASAAVARVFGDLRPALEVLRLMHADGTPERAVLEDELTRLDAKLEAARETSHAAIKDLVDTSVLHHIETTVRPRVALRSGPRPTLRSWCCSICDGGADPLWSVGAPNEYEDVDGSRLLLIQCTNGHLTRWTITDG